MEIEKTDFSDDKIINMLLNQTKDSEEVFNSYDQWEKYKGNLPIPNGEDFKDDRVTTNSPFFALSIFFDDLRYEEWGRVTNAKREKDLSNQYFWRAINVYPYTYWYKSKVYYRLNPVLERVLNEQGDRVYDSKRKTKWGIYIPSSVLNYMTYKSFFVRTSPNAFKVDVNDTSITIGFFVTFDKDLFSEGNYLSIHVLQKYDEAEELQILPIWFYLPHDDTITIGECINRAMDVWRFSSDESKSKVHDMNLCVARRAIQYIMYLCSDKADIELISKGALNESTKIRHRYGEVTQYAIGDRQSKLLLVNDLGDKEYFLRTGHWKGVRHGKRGSENERIVLTWIGPTVVTNWEHSTSGRYCIYSELDKTVREEEEKEDNALIRDLQQYPLDVEDEKDIDDEDPIEKEAETDENIVIRRRRRRRSIAMKALRDAEYCCEICNDHETFIRKINGLPYTEPHHLIPLAYKNFFSKSLDKVENIVSLCSNCHNNIHYGMDSEELLEQLYDNRKESLSQIGINISLDDLLDMYR